MSLNLIKFSEDFKENINEFKNLKNEIPKLHTETLVGSYRNINESRKLLDSFRNKMRDEIVDKRIFQDGVEIDEEGNRYLTANNQTVKAVKRINKYLDKKKAEDFLKENHLYYNVVEYECKGDSSFLNGMNDIIEKLKSLDEDLAYELEDLKNKLDIKERIDEKKLEDLKDLKFIKEEDYNSLFSIDDVYALYALKEKKG